MKVLALDLSTKTGFAVIENDSLIEYGLIRVEVEDFNVNDFPEKSPKYPFNIIDTANEMAKRVAEVINRIGPDLIAIENTVKGRNRHTQRILEFIHKAILEMIRATPFKFKYFDPSEWRHILEIRLSKEDKSLNNKIYRLKKKTGDRVIKIEGKRVGRKNKKHLSVEAANRFYDLKLKLKDNDIADAICLGKACYASYLKDI